MVRCSVHDADHAQWLVEQGREGNMEKEEVGALLCKEDKEGSCLLSLLDFDVQIDVAIWSEEAWRKVALWRGIDFDHGLGQWLVEQGREGSMTKEKVSALLCAHKMSPDFIQSLISHANEGNNWSKEEVGEIVCKKNRDNRLILATLDKETQRQVAMFNQAKTCSAVPYMDADFLEWLYQEAVDGRWKEKLVFDAVVKEELGEKSYFSSRIKPGG